MNKREDIATNLLNLYNPNSYSEFGEGFFVNKPAMTGYYYIFQDVKEPKFCLILNTSEIEYKGIFSQMNDFIYIVFNINTLEEFVENLSDQYLPYILEIITEHMNKEDTRNLPYAYYYDENGELKIDPKKASEVKEIYDRYQDVQSVRQIATERKTNFSHIRDILHDCEGYMQMQQKILPITILKQVQELLAQNVKGRFRKETFEDRLKQVRARKKKLKGMSLGQLQQ